MRRTKRTKTKTKKTRHLGYVEMAAYLEAKTLTFTPPPFLQADFISAMDDSDASDSDVEMEAKIERQSAKERREGATKKPRLPKAADDDNDDDEEDEEVAWSDLDEESRAGLAVRQRQTTNNVAALTAALARISDATASLPFSVLMAVGAAGRPPTADAVPDVQDDTARETALLQQCQQAVVAARTLLRKEGAAFSRPTDYFAEMVKDDGHMAQVRGKLVEAATARRAAADARKQRELKKFGKRVQVERQQERARDKKVTLEKIQSLKRSEYTERHRERHRELVNRTQC